MVCEDLECMLQNVMRLLSMALMPVSFFVGTLYLGFSVCHGLSPICSIKV